MRPAGQALAQFWKTVAPTKRAAMFRFGPDALYGGLAMARLPEEATWGERLSAGTENLGAGVLASLLGIGGGQIAARGIGKWKGLNLQGQAYEDLVTAADFLGGMGAAIYPYPIERGIYDNIAKRTSQNLNAPTPGDIAERELQETLISALVNAGGYVGRMG